MVEAYDTLWQLMATVDLRLYAVMVVVGQKVEMWRLAEVEPVVEVWPLAAVVLQFELRHLAAVLWRVVEPKLEMRLVWPIHQFAFAALPHFPVPVSKPPLLPLRRNTAVLPGSSKKG